MGLSGILFSPHGRISRAEFWRGVTILIGVYLITTVVSAYAPFAIAMIVGLVPLLILYPLLCVYGKRLHDNGRTAWLSVLVFIGFWAIAVGLQVFLTPILAPEFAAFQADLEQQVANQEIGFMDVMELTSERSNEALVPSIISTVVAALICAFLIARLESDPDENEHGMPPGGSAPDTFG